MAALVRQVIDVFTYLLGSKAGPATEPSAAKAKADAVNPTLAVVIVPPAPIPKDLCVVCVVGVCANANAATCSGACREKLCKEGPSDARMCNYCLRQPTLPGMRQCGPACEDAARTACLLCKSRPKTRFSYLCGKACKRVVLGWSPYLLLPVPRGHVTHTKVVGRFEEAWKYSGTAARPPVWTVLKVIGTKLFFAPFNEYKTRVGNVVCTYHGTTKACRLGLPAQSGLCAAPACALCSILRTSFKTERASASTAFGAGIYTSTASNKAYNYTGGGTGAIIVSSVALGRVKYVTAFNEVRACPPGFDSVVFDRGRNGSLNETIVYDNDAIRPVYVILF